MKHPMRRLLHEPMLHFVLLGGLIFALWWGLNPASVRGDTRIAVTAADVQRIRLLATRQWGHPPGPQALDALVKAYVREEVLYREALASGLDRDDVIVRRRLVQKMESLVQDSGAVPTEAELKAYWMAHRADYAQSPRISMQQVFFSTDLRGPRARQDATTALKNSANGAAPAGGDPLMLPTLIDQQTPQSLAKDYGADFATRVLALPVGVWRGPLPSALGVHLVRVVSQDAASDPDFPAVRDRVLQDWTRLHQNAAQEAAYQQARKRYQVEVDAGALGLAAGGAQP